MATQKKFLAFSFILALVMVMTTGIHAFSKSNTGMSNKEVGRESVTGKVTEIIQADKMKFMRVVPETGDDAWVAVFDYEFNKATAVIGGEYTFEGPVYKNYKVKILKRKFKRVILSSGPQ